MLSSANKEPIRQNYNVSKMAFLVQWSVNKMWHLQGIIKDIGIETCFENFIAIIQ